jgi:uncharacterized membrane protein HdeD (DUF308 family)
VDYLKTMRWTLFTTGAVLCVLGVLALLYPLASILSLALFIGVGFIVAGLNHLVPYFSMRGHDMRPRWLLPQGILDVLLGVLMVTHTGLTVELIFSLLGGWVLFMGILRIAGAFRLKELGFGRWWVALLNGFLLIAWGALLLSSSFFTLLLTMWLISSGFICAGLLVIAEGRLIYAGSAR